MTRRTLPTAISGEQGTSIVELMFSTAIIAVVLISMIYGMTIQSRLSSNARLSDAAVAELTSVRDEILSCPFDQTMILFPANSQVTNVNVLPSRMLTVTYPTGAGDPLRVMLTVQWRTPENQMRTRTLEFLKKK
ncbi:MAG: hypothetical protein WC712_05400 [Candidatus Brocadiia bacterium]